MHSEVIDCMMKSICQLPGIGPKSARRLTLHILKYKETVMTSLLHSLSLANDKIKSCSICYNISEADPCHICSNPKREKNKICIVKDVADLWILEDSKIYNGLYHVLGGNLSAVENIGPNDINLQSLIQRTTSGIEEVIIATDATLSGQTTAHYIANALKLKNIITSRLAFGIPIGGELDYLDNGTLEVALRNRSKLIT
ncbi:Recombination protein RecR [Candidatus Xenohaliotis californiensis]|uniref:Recombination protein RecR n=1 Tax=Candidatus Xenohaliotis californiensis TaxID=84677 RepID=A0ABP0EU98_9RICK|nr:Recombination protein RecR [Candidatus Xenohaliotis californiensis]